MTGFEGDKVERNTVPMKQSLPYTSNRKRGTISITHSCFHSEVGSLKMWYSLVPYILCLCSVNFPPTLQSTSRYETDAFPGCVLCCNDLENNSCMFGSIYTFFSNLKTKKSVWRDNLRTALLFLLIHLLRSPCSTCID